MQPTHLLTFLEVLFKSIQARKLDFGKLYHLCLYYRMARLSLLYQDSMPKLQKYLSDFVDPFTQDHCCDTTIPFDTGIRLANINYFEQCLKRDGNNGSNYMLLLGLEIGNEITPCISVLYKSVIASGDSKKIMKLMELINNIIIYCF